jgi:predicted tellurium resistance membrane protein TerC
VLELMQDPQLVLAWMIGLTEPLFTLFGDTMSGRDLILIGGGLFLLWKSVMEIHQLLEARKATARPVCRPASPP